MLEASEMVIMRGGSGGGGGRSDFQYCLRVERMNTWTGEKETKFGRTASKGLEIIG